MVLDRVKDLMKKIIYPIAAAKLRVLSNLRAKINNVTRWSYTCEMMLRYQVHVVIFLCE